MNYKEFIKIMEDDGLKSAYLFYGEEEYLIKDILIRIQEKYIDEAFEALNYIIIEGKDASFDTILNACETLPFMSQKKIVLVKDLSQLLAKDEAYEKEILSSYIEGLDNYISLILIEPSSNIKKGSKMYKTINRLGGIVEFSKLKGKDLTSWIEDRFRTYGKKISYSNINYFIQQTAYFGFNQSKTLYDLENEILKVINYVSEEEVLKDHIDLILSKPIDINIFNLLTSINRKDGENALKIFNEMYISNEPVQRILFMITRQLRLMLSYKLYREKGYMEGEILEKLQLKSYEYEKISNQSSNFTLNQLERALNYCLDVDKKIKTSSFDEKVAIEMLIINLCFNI